MQRNKKTAEGNFTDNQTHILKEPKTAPRLIEMEAKLNGRDMEILFDTGWGLLTNTLIKKLSKN